MTVATAAKNQQRANAPNEPSRADAPDKAGDDGASARAQSAELNKPGQGGGTHVVQRGETLWAIAEAELGDGTEWTRLYAANRDRIRNPHALKAGTKIVIPGAGAGPGGGDGQGAAKPAPPSGGTYTVRRGDTLSRIAGRLLGAPRRWNELWQANREALPDPNRVSVGQVLVIPGGNADESQAAAAQKPRQQADQQQQKAEAKEGGDTARGGDGGNGGDGAKGQGKGDDGDGMAPDGPRATGKTPLERQLAAIYNTKGKLVVDESKRLGIEPGVAAAVLAVESSGSGFRNGEMVIRFEAHIFRDLAGQYVSVRHSGRQSDEYDAFERAKKIDKEAAHDAISMGAAQIMGFNAERVGYGSAVEMFQAFAASEKAQNKGLFDFVRTSRGLHKAARNKDWATFARLYNGAGYAKNAYDTKMAAAYAAWGRVTTGLLAGS